MHNGKYVFSQLLDFIDKDVFLRIANKYDGNRYVKSFTCWNQLAVLIFGQLSNRESLRDVVLATQAHARKAYNLGFGKHASKSTLADASNRKYLINRCYASERLCLENLTTIKSMNVLVLPNRVYLIV